ncbi:MAG: type II secretion system protein [Patescibacteria group bacterium]
MEKKRSAGFTVIELLIVIGIIAMLASTLAVVINPARQLAKARDTERETDLYGILAAVYQYQAEHSGALPDTDGNPQTSNFPTNPVCIGTDPGCYDLASAGDTGEEVVPVYMAAIPADPKTGTVGDTQYIIFLDANNRLVASASGETKGTITITR